MTLSKYVADHESFGRFMLSRQMQKPVTEVAEAVKAVAVANTPKATGKMADSYDVNELPAVTVAGSPRVASEVRNEDDAAPAVEFGGKRNKAIRPLGSAASLFGDVRGEE